MTSNARAKRTAIKPTIRQKVWNYMRRNRVFMISDVMAITGANYKNIQKMFKIYEYAGYVKIIKRQKPFSSTQLKLIKCTGVKAPAYDNKRDVLFDYNTNEEISIKTKSAIQKVLDCLDKGMVTKEEVAKQAGISLMTAKKCYQELKDKNIMTLIKPIRRNQFGYRFFKVDIGKAKALKEKLLQDEKL